MALNTQLNAIKVAKKLHWSWIDKEWVFINQDFVIANNHIIYNAWPWICKSQNRCSIIDMVVKS